MAVKLEQISNDFDGTISQILKVWGVTDTAIPYVVSKIAKHDLKRSSPTQLKSNPHVTNNKFSSDFISSVVTALMAHEDIGKLVYAQGKDLGYE